MEGTDRSKVRRSDRGRDRRVPQQVNEALAIYARSSQGCAVCVGFDRLAHPQRTARRMGDSTTADAPTRTSLQECLYPQDDDPSLAVQVDTEGRRQ